MRDADKRRAYDLIYPSITRSQSNTQNTQTPRSQAASNSQSNTQHTQTPRPQTASTSQSEAASELSRIHALRKEKEDRNARWKTRQHVFEASMFEMRRSIRRLEQEVQNLASIQAAEAAVEARKNSWGTWLMSPFYKQLSESEEEKARKDRERTERRIEKDLKERRLASHRAELAEKERQMEQAQDDVDAANLRTDQTIHVIEATRRSRETRERLERERVERERMEKERVAKEKAEREARAAESARQAEYLRSQHRRQDGFYYPYFSDRRSSAHQAHTSSSACVHRGWWDTVQYPTRTACPRCRDSWNYLLQCPGCKMKACPKCQSELRPSGRFRG